MNLEKLFEFCIKHDIEIRIASGMPHYNSVIQMKFINHKKNEVFCQDINPEMLSALISSQIALENLLREVEFRMGLREETDR